MVLSRLETLMAHKDRTPRRALKIALVDAQITQRQLARVTQIDETTVSRIVNGEYPGTSEQRKAIARTLLRSVHELFPESEAVAS